MDFCWVERRCTPVFCITFLTNEIKCIFFKRELKLLCSVCAFYIWQIAAHDFHRDYSLEGKNKLDIRSEIAHQMTQGLRNQICGRDFSQSNHVCL